MAKTYKIRKLTPKECGRLMGVSDEEIDKMLNCGLNDAALYKMYGNSIVVNCMEHIFKNLFVDKKENKDIQLW